MSLVKWEPFDEFEKIFRDLSTLPAHKTSNLNLDLACDVYEDGNNLIAEMNLPGLEADKIDIEVEDNHLHISGRREEVKEKKEKSHYTKEIRRGSFERIIPLPNPVKQDQVEAEYKDGVLKIIMPRQELKKTNKIKVAIK